MTAIWLALLSILSLAQGVPFPGAGTLGNHVPGNNLSFVQACKHIDGSAGTSHAINIGATGTCSASANPVAGHLVVVYIGYRANPTSQSCADTLGNTWTSTVSTANVEGLCWSVITTGGSADTLTFTSGSSVVGVELSDEFSGSAASPLDAAATTSAPGSPGSSWNGASYTSTNANDVIFGFGLSFTNMTYTQGTGYTLPTDGQAANTVPFSGYGEYQIVTATGTFTPAISASSTGSSVHTLTVGFKSN